MAHCSSSPLSFSVLRIGFTRGLKFGKMMVGHITTKGGNGPMWVGRRRVEVGPNPTRVPVIRLTIVGMSNRDDPLQDLDLLLKSPSPADEVNKRKMEADEHAEGAGVDAKRQRRVNDSPTIGPGPSQPVTTAATHRRSFLWPYNRGPMQVTRCTPSSDRSESQPASHLVHQQWGKPKADDSEGAQAVQKAKEREDKFAEVQSVREAKRKAKAGGGKVQLEEDEKQVARVVKAEEEEKPFGWSFESSVSSVSVSF
jgi:hypothetical protein